MQEAGIDSGAELDVTIALAVHNEAGHIETEIGRIREAMDASEYSYEIIVVDDASTDGSLKELGHIPDIKPIRLAKNRGSGFARKTATSAARGRVIVWSDVDMTYPNDRIPQLVKELDSGYDQVVGARTSEEGTHKLFRVPAKWFIRRLASYLVDEPIPDLNSGLRAFRRDVGKQFLHMLPAGFSCVTTLTMCFLANGYSVGYMPIDYAERAGRSKFHWYRDTKSYLTQVIRMVLTFNPLRIFMPLGFFLLVVGAAKLGYDIVTKDFRVGTNTLLIFFAAFQTFAIGLLADLVVRVTKPRTEQEPANR
ncbi:MAG: glycosyltransferase [Actinobacteria bacterium]|nr:glycosyltransferase [Actinomycetota bacterium]